MLWQPDVRSSLLVSIALLGACGENPVDERHEYVPGEVIVRFVEHATDEQYHAFVSEIGLRVLWQAQGRTIFWIKVHPDSALYVDERLSRRYDLFSDVGQNTYPFDDGEAGMAYLSARYRYDDDSADTAPGIEIVEAVGASVKRIIKTPRTELIVKFEVPIGSELHWRDTLQAYSIIEWASLNGIGYIGAVT